MGAIVSILGSVVCLFVGIASAATIHVPADYSTIYEALDAAASGDIVEVAPGTYDQFDTRPVWFGDNVSSIGFLKSGVTLRSSGGSDGTILRMDAARARPVILFGGGGEFQAQGFTLTGSLADLIAIAVESSDKEQGSLLLQDCVIRDYGLGATLTHEYAIDAYNASLHIQDCRFSNLDSPAAIAVFLYGGHHVVEDCFFESCTEGALEMVDLNDPDHESLTVRGCSFANNGGPFLGRGGVSAQLIYSVSIGNSWFFQNYRSILYGCPSGASALSTLIVRNSTFAEGTAPASEAAICAFANAVELSGSTFYGGASGMTALAYGGILPGSSLQLERNVFSYSMGAPAVWVGSVVVQSSCNVFWENAGGHTLGFSLGPTDLVSDPQFCDPSAQDFTVNAASPCLPWNNNGCGQIGAWGLGCGPVSVEPSSWGQIKALYR
jgi:hypothetical protein